MASSKFPVDFLLVPENVVDFAKYHREVRCNLRPEQRPEWKFEEKRDAMQFASSLESFWTEPVNPFLHSFKPNTWVALLFQGDQHGTIVTAVVSVTSIFWTAVNYPRLDFKHPPGMETLYWCPSFWGSFILAIARVPKMNRARVSEDHDAKRFLDIVRRHAVR